MAGSPFSCRTRDIAQLSIMVKNVRLVAYVCLPLTEPQNLRHDAVVERFRGVQITHCHVDMVDADNLNGH